MEIRKFFFDADGSFHTTTVVVYVLETLWNTIFLNTSVWYSSILDVDRKMLQFGMFG